MMSSFFGYNLFIVIVVLQTKADGSVLFEQVCKQLNLLEADYFGLEYQEGSTKVIFIKYQVHFRLFIHFHCIF